MSHVPFRERLTRPGYKVLAVGVIVGLFATAPGWGRRALRPLSFFQVRHVEVVGARYLAPGDLTKRLPVDTTMSVWDDLAPLERRLIGHPQVQRATIERKLPGTLVIRVTENLPIAMVETAAGLRAVDARGHTLPIDLTSFPVDLPVVAQRDPALLALLTALRDEQPGLFARIGEARRGGPGEFVVRLASAIVRTTSTVTPARFAELQPVEQDLARRKAHVIELDLRYRDQVIARLQ
ncbi:MAG: hypothetical protein NVS1B4_05680 [Gemmatimonadaceae bacterium]